MLDDKVILIIGGTGTIGSALVEHIHNNFNPKVIRILSRDESKQQFLRFKFKDTDLNLRFLIGDIREKDRLDRALQNVDIVFHLAALKHVEACEYNPFEAVKTNILGLRNVVESAIENNVEKVIFTSTDKAATPSNTMGVTKLMGEKLITASNYYKGPVRTKFYSVRFGNVMGSRGSIIPLIEEQVKNDQPIILTDSQMTRYIMSIEDAIEFIIKTLDYAQGGEVFVLKMNAIKIVDLIDILIDHYTKKYQKKREEVQIKEVGLFAGEKMYEELFSIEESERTYEMEDMYVIIPQLPEVSNTINVKSYPSAKKFDCTKPFSSKSGPFLSKKEISQFLTKNNLI